MKETKLIFIGDKFYHGSGTMMSSIYTEDGERFDWLFVKRDLRNGHTVTIRPASKIEMEFYEKELAKMEAAMPPLHQPADPGNVT